MPSARCSDEEFIQLYRDSGSPTAVARALNVATSNVRRRKQKIERSHGVRLLTIDSRPRYNQSMLITADRIEVKLTINDGVILVSGDQHYWPDHIPLMHRAICHLAKKLSPFAIVWNGDSFDGASISRFPSIGWESKPSLKAELDCVQERSTEILKASPASKKIWNAGNHDLRFESRLAQNAPEYRGIKGIHLKDHFPEWTPAWFTTINDGTPSHTEIRHREKGGIHAGYNNTVSSGVTLVTGHDHRADVVSYDDRRGRRYGVRHGMGADSCRDGPFVHYLEGRKAQWQSGMAVLTYKDGKLMYPDLVLAWDEDSIQFRGEVIKV